MEQITNYLDELHSSSFISVNVPEKKGIKIYHFSICGNHKFITITPKYDKTNFIHYEISFGDLYIGHNDIFEDVKIDIGGITEREYNIVKKRHNAYSVWDVDTKFDTINLFLNLYPRKTKC